MARNEEKHAGRLNRLWLQQLEKEKLEKNPPRPGLGSLKTAEDVKKWIPRIKKDIDFYLKQSQVSCYPDRHIHEFSEKIDQLSKEYRAYIRKLRQLEPQTDHIPWTDRPYARKHKLANKDKDDDEDKKPCQENQSAEEPVRKSYKDGQFSTIVTPILEIDDSYTQLYGYSSTADHVALDGIISISSLQDKPLEFTNKALMNKPLELKHDGLMHGPLKISYDEGPRDMPVELTDKESRSVSFTTILCCDPGSCQCSSHQESTDINRLKCSRCGAIRDCHRGSKLQEHTKDCGSCDKPNTYTCASITVCKCSNVDGCCRLNLSRPKEMCTCESMCTSDSDMSTKSSRNTCRRKSCRLDISCQRQSGREEFRHHKNIMLRNSGPKVNPLNIAYSDSSSEDEPV